MDDNTASQKALIQERNELNTLINKGVSFSVIDVDSTKKRRFFCIIKQRVPVKVERSFKIEEPTLGTLDRLASEWIEFNIDEAKMKSNDGMQHALSMVGNHALRCAKIIALAVLGSDYLIPKSSRNGVIRYDENTKQLNELTALFARTIKPSQLYQLCTRINVMCNLGDFMNSIRLMSADRTTMPIRIEENNEG